jgi:hypothetical protein
LYMFIWTEAVDGSVEHTDGVPLQTHHHLTVVIICVILALVFGRFSGSWCQLLRYMPCRPRSILQADWLWGECTKKRRGIKTHRSSRDLRYLGSQ